MLLEEIDGNLLIAPFSLSRHDIQDCPRALYRAYIATHVPVFSVSTLYSFLGGSYRWHPIVLSQEIVNMRFGFALLGHVL